MKPRLVFLLAEPRPAKAVLEEAFDRLHAAGARVLLVTYQDLPAKYGDLPVDEAHALAPGAAAHGPAFRRAVRRADPAEKYWLHVMHDDWVAGHAKDAVLAVALGPHAKLAARQLARRYHGVRGLASINEAVQLLEQRSRVDQPALAGIRRLRSRRILERLPVTVSTILIGAPRIPERRRYSLARSASLRLLRAGRDSSADGVVLAALKRIRTPRVRADLLGEVVSWSLAHGHQPALAQLAYAAELAVADRHYARGRYRAAGETFGEAMRTAFHRVLHFDGLTSPLAADPAAFTEPLRGSLTAQALRAPRGRARTADAAPTHDPGQIRLLLATRVNADFLGEIREHFGDHPGFDTRFVDFAGAEDLTRFARAPETIVTQTLAGKQQLARVAEATFREHLDRADVVFVEWCTALAALITQVDPKDTRIIVRMHSYEAFTVWPHLMDFTRVDDMVFVSDHLRDLAVAAIPALTGSGAPRLHVVANAMDLRRFDRPKPDDARFTLAVVGASKMVKDPRWAIEVLRHLRRHDERYRLLLVRGRIQDPTAATRTYAEALRLDLAELEPSGAVQVLSHTDDVPEALEEVGVILSSSVRESFHMGLVEGAASGAVPVVRDWPYFPGSARELFPHDWVVDTPEEASARILATTSSDEVWRRTGRAAADYATGRWDWEVVKHDFDRLLRP